MTEDIDAAELARRRAFYIPLTDAVRDLIDATIRTEVDDAVITQVRDEIAAATAKLRVKQLAGTYGLQNTPDGETVSWGQSRGGAAQCDRATDHGRVLPRRAALGRAHARDLV